VSEEGPNNKVSTKSHRSSWGDSECQETSWGACCERRMVFLLRQGLMDQITFGHGVLQACVHKSSWSPTCGWYWALVRDGSGLPCENFVDHMGSCVGPAPGKITWILCGAYTWWDHMGSSVGPTPSEITRDLCTSQSKVTRISTFLSSPW